jgi:predicted Zn-dependent protease
LAGLSCQVDNIQPQNSFVADFFTNVSSLELIVAYEENAEPYTTFNAKNAWNIVSENLAQLLQGRNITYTIPTELNQMAYLGKIGQENYSNTDLQNLAKDLQKFTNKEAQKGLVVLFLDGYFTKDGEILDNVLGLNINGTAIVALFKPVIESATPSYTLRTLVEQTTLTHEIGHALGLVNNGITLTSPHHDEVNGAHCTNKDCVMYWSNGGGNVVDFVQPYLTGGKIDLFGEECLKDVREF